MTTEDLALAANRGSWLINWSKKMLSDGYDLLLLVVGNTRSGKSVAGIDLCLLLDEKGQFAPERIVFTTKDYLRFFTDPNGYSGMATMYDDAGIGLSNREWQTFQNRVFGKLAQGYAYRHFVTVITTPRINFIELQARQLFRLVLESSGTRGVFKLKEAVPPAINFKNGYTMFQYPTMEFHDMVYKIKTVSFPMAPRWIHDAYLERKDTFMRSSLKEFQKGLSDDVNMDNGYTGVQRRCKKCGHGWLYKGKATKAACPSCGYRNDFLNDNNK